MAVLDELLVSDGVIAGEPASAGAIGKVADLFKVELPADLMTLWRTANGVVLEAIDARILSCEEALEFLCDGYSAPAFIEHGFLPLVDDRQSNYCAVALRDPLLSRVVFVPHDDGPKLLFASLDSCLRAIVDCMASGDTLDLLLHETKGDYAPDARRSSEDQAAARALMATDGENHEWNFAAQLLDESNIEEFSRLLETNHFVRRDVRERLLHVQALDIRKLLSRDRKEFEHFTAALAKAAQTAGFKVTKANSDHALKIGGIYIEVEAFFHLRNEPDAMSKAIARIQELIARSKRRAF